MLGHVKRETLAQRWRSALHTVRADDRIRTPDLGGRATLQEFTDAVINRIRS